MYIYMYLFAAAEPLILRCLELVDVFFGGVDCDFIGGSGPFFYTCSFDGGEFKNCKINTHTSIVIYVMFFPTMNAVNLTGRFSNTTHSELLCLHTWSSLT